MINNEIFEIFNRGELEQLIDSKEFIDQLEGEEKIGSELLRAVSIMDSQMDSNLYHETIQKYLQDDMTPRVEYVVRLHQACYEGWTKTKVEEAIAILDKCDRLYEGFSEKDKEELQFYRIWSFHLKGTYYFTKDRAKALEILQRGLSLLEKTTFASSGLKPAMMVHTGIAHMRNGEYETAERYFKDAIAISRPLGNRAFQVIPLHDIAVIQLIKGNIQEAQKIIEKGYPIAVESKFLRAITGYQELKGRILVQLKEYDKALDHYKQALPEIKKSGLVQNETWILYALITLLTNPDAKIKLGNREEEATMYLNELDILAKRSSNIEIDAIYQLSRASVFQYKPRLKDKMQAQPLYQNIITDENITMYYRLQAMLSQCDLLLIELKALEDETIIDEIISIFNRLTDMAKGIIPITLEVLIVKSKLALVQEDVEQAQDFLSEALIIAKTKKLELYIEKIEREMGKLRDQISEWHQFESEKRSINQRLNQLEVKDYLQQAIEITALHSRE